MNEINDIRKINKFKYKDMHTGDCFMNNGRLFIKTPANAVSLADGIVEDFYPDELVELVKVAINIYDA